MNRLKTNIILDVAMLVVAALLSISGAVIKFAMPSHGIHHKALHTTGEILGMSRCTWRDIHMWIGIIFIILLITHIALHWSTVSAFMKKNIPNPIARRTFYVILLILSAVAVLPWIYIMM